VAAGQYSTTKAPPVLQGIGVEMSDQAREPRRQDRGKQRMESLLRAAEQVFAELGYERATTNLIASRASVSPGTLYQFYPNKEAMAEALAVRYAEELEGLHHTVFDMKIAAVSLPELIDAIVDPFLKFHDGAPAFDALFLAASVSPELAGRIRVLHDTVGSRIISIFELRAPEIKGEDLRWAAETAVGIFRGLLPLITPLKGSKRSRAIRELKLVLFRYLEPLLAAQKR
jgi:AcrR family transcriptional regulator